MTRDSTVKQTPWEYPLEARVIIHGLVDSPGLNGCAGTVKSLLKNFQRDAHTSVETLLALNCRQVIELDGNTNPQDADQSMPITKTAILLRPSNLLYEPRELKSLNEEELKAILKFKKVDMPGIVKKNNEKQTLQHAVMKCLRPVIRKYNLSKKEITHEIGGVLTEAHAVAKFEEHGTQNFAGAITTKLIASTKTVEIPPVNDSDPPLELLGGLVLPEGRTNEIPQDTVFARLHRPRKPVKMTMAKKGALLLQDNPIGMEYFHKITEGALTITFMEDLEREDFMIILWKNCESTEPIAHIQFMPSYTKSGGYDIHTVSHFPEMNINQIKLRHHLKFHLWYRIFRTAAALLSVNFRLNLHGLLMDHYQADNKWNHALDLSISMADAKFICCDRNTVAGLLSVGEALEATGSHDKAALIYKDLAKLMAERRVSNEDMVANSFMPHEFAGTAFLRAKKYEAALNQYLLALKRLLMEADHDFLLTNDNYTTHILTKVFRAHGIASQKNHLARYSLALLMSVAGFTFPGAEEAKSSLYLLQPRYMFSPDNALNALVRAIEESCSGQQFSEFLASYLIVDKWTVPMEVSERTGPLRSAKHEARYEIKRRHGTNHVGGANGCDNPSCTFNKRTGAGWEWYDCTCGGVVYCSSTCQTADWPQHKKVHKLLMKTKSKK